MWYLGENYLSTVITYLNTWFQASSDALEVDTAEVEGLPDGVELVPGEEEAGDESNDMDENYSAAIEQSLQQQVALQQQTLQQQHALEVAAAAAQQSQAIIANSD